MARTSAPFSSKKYYEPNALVLHSLTLPLFLHNIIHEHLTLTIKDAATYRDRHCRKVDKTKGLKENPLFMIL